MPVVNPPCFDGLQVVGPAHDDINVSVVDPPVWPGTGAVVANGSYYISRWDPGAGDTDQLCEQFEAALDGVAGVNCEVTRATATGLVTITNNHAVNPLSVRFTDHTAPGVIDVGVMLGFFAASAAMWPVIGPIAANGGTFTGPYQHYYGWYPDRPHAAQMGRRDRPGVLTSDGVTTQAPSGRVVTTKFYETTRNLYEFKSLAAWRTTTRADAVEAYTSWEQFWQRIGSVGQRFRFYVDRDDLDGPEGTGPWVYTCDDKMVKGGTESAKRTSAFYDELYDLDVGVHLYVP